METTKDQTAAKTIRGSSTLPAIGSPTLRCIACGVKFTEAAPDQRWRGCGDLLEVVYSGLDLATRRPASSSADALKALWRNRKSSLAVPDQSGVWRFRDLLPILSDPGEAVTLREGNTPIYRM